MSGAFGLAGYYFGRKPTSATSEAAVSVAHSSMPWQTDHPDHDTPDSDKHFKYQYHPRGDKSQTPKNAPSALNTVIVPNVTLPKVSFVRLSVAFILIPVRNCTISSTNGAKMDIKSQLETLAKEMNESFCGAYMHWAPAKGFSMNPKSSQ